MESKKVVRYHLTPAANGWVCQEQMGEWKQFWTLDFLELGPEIQAAIEQALVNDPSRDKTIDVANAPEGGFTIGMTRFFAPEKE